MSSLCREEGRETHTKTTFKSNEGSGELIKRSEVYNYATKGILNSAAASFLIVVSFSLLIFLDELR